MLGDFHLLHLLSQGGTVTIASRVSCQSALEVLPSSMFGGGFFFCMIYLFEVAMYAANKSDSSPQVKKLYTAAIQNNC